MEDHIMKAEDVLKFIKSKYKFQIEKQENERLILRLPFSLKEEAENFRKELSSETSTEWILYNDSSKRTKRFHKVWICHLSGWRKKSGSKRDAKCKAKLDIKIKDMDPESIARDCYLRQDPPLRTVVMISLIHTHTIHSAAALKLLRVPAELKGKFFKYFDDGIPPGEAISLHESELLCLDKFEDIADSSKNPTHRQVYYMHDQWRLNNFGPCHNPFQKLKENIQEYEKNGTTVKLTEGELWAVLIVTPVMKRTQMLPSSKEMIFVDSSCSCELTSSTITLLLSASKAGALPLAVLIHKNQTAENFTIAFRLLKDNFGNFFDGSNNFIFMTDDSTAEKNGLRNIWPNNIQLLCHFHVAQAEWRWLFAQKDIPLNERPRLMRLFQAVMYADSEPAVQSAADHILRETKYPLFVKRFKHFFVRKLEWVSLYRNNLMIRGNNTNNYAEASIRILKDIVLCRTKAYNVVALVKFTNLIWEQYLQKKLLTYAFGRNSKPYLLYSSLSSKMSGYKIEDVVEVQPMVFIMPSSSDNSKSYVVDASTGVCSCPSGKTGAFCKHQCFLMKHEKLRLPNAPPLSSQDRYELGKIAMGNKCSKIPLFQDLNPDGDVAEMNYEDVEETHQIISSVPCKENCVENQDDRINVEVLRGELLMEHERIKTLITQTSSNEVVHHLLNTYKSVQSVDDLKRLTFFRSLRSRKIYVQPTSVSRRRKGLTHSRKRVPAGRPSKGERKVKRCRNLQKNINLNIPNVK